MTAATGSKTPDFARFDPAFGAAIAKAFTADGGSLLLVDLDGLHDVNGRLAGMSATRSSRRSKRAQALGTEERWPSGRVEGTSSRCTRPDSRSRRVPQGRSAASGARCGRREAAPRTYHCTASIGVANAPRDAKTPSDLHARPSSRSTPRRSRAATPSPDARRRDGAQVVLLHDCSARSPEVLAERQKKKEAVFLREALDDLLRKYDRAS